MENPLYTLITGSSEGFGKALAIECASRGMNLILVALPDSGLMFLEDLLERNFQISVVYFEYDLTQEENCHQLFKDIRQLGLSVNILINNAGIGGTHLFEERDIEFYQKQIQLNVLTPTLLSHLFLADLCKNSPSYILNVGSMAGFFFLPRKQVYGATKSYLLAFSKNLGIELAQKNVHVCAVCPGGMNTNPLLTIQNRNCNLFGRLSIMNPEDVARITIDKMLKNNSLIVPGFLNRCMVFLNKVVPSSIRKNVTVKMMNKIHPGRIYSIIKW